MHFAVFLNKTIAYNLHFLIQESSVYECDVTWNDDLHNNKVYNCLSHDVVT